MCLRNRASLSFRILKSFLPRSSKTGSQSFLPAWHTASRSHLIGHWEFYGLDFGVTPAVLIPRPETELMVERAQAWLQQHPHLRRGADVGTGSGCIAISLAKQIKDLRVLAMDRSWEALQVARRNAVFHQVTERVAFVQGDLLTAVKGPFDLVCANLPYIPRSSLESLSVAHHEPRQALDGGSDGVSWIRQLIDDAPRWLSAPALMLLEMQYDQGDTVSGWPVRVSQTQGSTSSQTWLACRASSK